MKTNYKNVNEELNFQHYQEYEPSDNPTDHPNLGESSSSLPKCHHEFSEIDVPIALRKAIRSCTKHSLSKYVSWSDLSSSFSATNCVHHGSIWWS